MDERNKKRRRIFLRWLAQGSDELQTRANQLISTVVPQLEALGFEWVEEDLEGGRSQPNAISMERRTRKDEVDFVRIIFDKHRSSRFKVISGTKVSSPPHHWIKAGDLVRFQSELDRAKWWGPMWWHLDKAKVFDNALEKVGSLIPELTQFLSDGVRSPNIYEWPINN